MTVLCQLICEGACNPILSQADVEVAAARKAYAIDAGLPTHVMSMLRVLRHTTHSVDDTVAVCTICGSTRRFGGNPSFRRQPWAVPEQKAGA